MFFPQSIMAGTRANVILVAFFSTVTLAIAEEESDCSHEESCRDKTFALHLKIGAIASILVASTIGVCLPIVGKSISALRPDKDLFFVVKAFAAGVILATGFVHILPDAVDSLTSDCLNDNPWQTFPFAGFIAMMASVCSLIVDAVATVYYQRVYSRKQQPMVSLQEIPTTQMGDGPELENQSHLHGHGCSRGNGKDEESVSILLRHRVISQVLELGIVAHSVIIGISLGTSQSPCTIRPLIAALTFHQFFEGIGLGGCLVQAGFKNRSTALMALFFSITTPVGIVVGIAISSAYNENSPTALIVEGVFDAVSAGILIYMSLVDLLAADFLSSRMQDNVTLQLWAYSSLLTGAGAMSLLAKWA